MPSYVHADAPKQGEAGADGVPAYSRCTKFDGADSYAGEVPWPSPPRDQSDCIGLTPQQYITVIKDKVLGECKKKFIDAKTLPWAEAYEKGLDFSSVHGVLLSLSELPSEFTKAAVLPSVARSFAQCVALGAIDASDSSPGDKQIARNAVTVAFDAFDIYNVGAKDGGKWSKAMEKIGGGSKWSGSYLALHVSTKVLKVFERGKGWGEMYLEWDPIQEFGLEGRKKRLEKLGLDHCRADAMLDSDIKELAEETKKHLKELRDEFAWNEKGLLCARFIRESMLKQGFSPTEEQIQIEENHAKNLKLIDEKQCLIASWLQSLYHFEHVQLPNVWKLRDETKAQYQEVLQAYFAIRRKHCSMTEAERAEQDRLMAKLRAIYSTKCAGGIEPAPDTVDEKANKTPEEVELVARLRREIVEGVAVCRRSIAKNAYDQLKFLGGRAAWECDLKDELPRYAEQLEVLRADVETIKSFLDGNALSEEAVTGPILQNCDFERAEALVRKFENDFRALKLTYEQCKSGPASSLVRSAADEARGHINRLRGEREQDEKQYLADLENSLSAAQLWMTYSRAMPEDFCKLLRDAASEAEKTLDKKQGGRLALVCPALSQADGIKSRAKDILKQAEDKLRDRTAADMFLSRAKSELDKCDFPAVDKTVSELKARDDICVSIEAEIKAIVSQRKAIEEQLLSLEQNLAEAEGQFESAKLNCSPQAMREALDSIVWHQCLDKKASPELKSRIEALRGKQGLADAVSAALETAGGKLVEAENLLKQCKPEQAISPLRAAGGAIGELRGFGMPGCLSELEPKLASLEAEQKELMSTLSGLQGRVHMLDSSVTNLERKAKNPGALPDEQAFVREINRQKSALLGTAVKLDTDIENGVLRKSCRASLVGAVASAKERITRINAATGRSAPPDWEVARPGPESEVDSGEEGGGDELIQDTIGSLVRDAENAADRVGSGARSTSGAINTRASEAGRGAGRASGGWQPPEPPDQEDFTDAVNEGRRQSGDAPAYDPSGRVIKPGDYEPYGRGRRTDGWEGERGQGRPDRRGSPRGAGEGGCPEQLKRKEAECIAMVESEIRRLKDYRRQVGSPWTPQDEAGYQQARRSCFEPCRIHSEWSSGR